MTIRMTTPDAIAPYIGQAEQELDELQETGRALAELVVDTARRLAEDEGNSLPLCEALDHLTTAERRFWRGLTQLVEQRAWELWHAEQAAEVSA